MVESEAIIGGATPIPIRKKSSFAGDVLTLVSGTTLAQALSVLIAPVLSRLYALEAFGTAAVFTSVVGIISVIACLRYEFAIMLPERDEEAANVLAVSLSSVLVITGVSAILLLLARGSIVRLLNAPDLALYLWLAPLALLANGVFQALNYWNSRTKHFGRLSIARVSAAVTTGGAQLGMGVVGQAHAGGLIGAGLAGSAVVTAVLGGQIWRNDRELFQKSVRLRRVFDSLIRYRKFPLIDSWGGFLNSVSWQLPPLMLSAFFSQATVGYYALAYRLIQLPMALIGSTIAQVFFQRASEVRSNSQGNLASTVEMVFRRLVALGLLPALLMTITGRELFVVVFGKNWAEAGIYVQILGLWMFFWFISSPLSTLFAVFEHQELGLIVQVAIFATRIVSLAIGGILDNVYLALGLFAGSGTLVYGGLTIWNMALAGVSLRRSLEILLREGLYCIPTGMVLVFLKILCNAPAWLILGISAMALVIHSLLVLRRDPLVYHLISFAHRRSQDD